MKPRVVVLVGLPASGKSTWLERQGVTALSSDQLRHLLSDDITNQNIHPRVFLTLRYLLRQRLALGMAASYVDATNLTPAERRPYLDIARWFGAAAEAVYFDTPLDVCLERNRNRARVVPEEALRAMAAKLTPPCADEGFSAIRTIRPGDADSSISRVDTEAPETA